MPVSENINIVSVLLAVVGFLIVYVLNGIKGEIRDTKRAVQSLEVDLRKLLSDLDKRVTVIEARCENVHAKD